jgi:hypothetical protein
MRLRVRGSDPPIPILQYSAQIRVSLDAVKGLIMLAPLIGIGASCPFKEAPMLRVFQCSAAALLIAVVPSQPPTQNRRAARPVDLLKTVRLPDAKVSGTWKKSADGLRTDSAAPARLRLGPAPKGEYDLIVTFTRSSGSGRLGLILSYDGTSFGWFLGGRGKPADGFSFVDSGISKEKDSALQLVASDAKKHTVKIKVRKDGVTAFVDRVKKGEVADYATLTLDDEFSVGDDMLGLFSGDPTIIFRSVSVVPFAEAAVAEKATTPQRESAKPVDSAIEENVVLPVMSTWHGTRTQLNQGGVLHCTMKVIDRDANLVVMRFSEGSFVAKWTFSLRGDRLYLEGFTQENGTASVTDVQAYGILSGDRMQIQYQWVYSGRRMARTIVLGKIEVARGD